MIWAIVELRHGTSLPTWPGYSCCTVGQPGIGFHLVLGLLAVRWSQLCLLLPTLAVSTSLQIQESWGQTIVHSLARALVKKGFLEGQGKGGDFRENLNRFGLGGGIG